MVTNTRNHACIWYMWICDVGAQCDYIPSGNGYLCLLSLAIIQASPCTLLTLSSGVEKSYRHPWANLRLMSCFVPHTFVSAQGLMTWVKLKNTLWRPRAAHKVRGGGGGGGVGAGRNIAMKSERWSGRQCIWKVMGQSILLRFQVRVVLVIEDQECPSFAILSWMNREWSSVSYDQ